MKFRLLTLFSIILALVIKTYAVNTRDGVIDEEEVELLATWELKNHEDSIQHQEHVYRIVDVIASSDKVTEEYTGAASLVKCNTYYEYTKLRRAANEVELNGLLLHDSPIIRVYAHRALMERELMVNPDFVAQIANDSTAIEWLNGDVLVRTTVMDLVSSNMFLVQEKDSLFADATLF